MKINLNTVDKENFLTIEGNFCGREGLLIIPNHIGCKFTKETLIFRSSVWDKNNGELLSGSFKKFYNFSEKPDLYPNPENFNDKIITTKIDGSCAILDVIDGQINTRTRGVMSSKTQPNFADYDLLQYKYPKLIEYLKKHPNYTILTEIVTPNNIIVIRYPEVDFYLLAVINKDSYSYLSYDETVEISKICDIQIPETHKFNTLEEIVDSVKIWKGVEGVVLSFNNYQDRVKIKAAHYLACHKIKSSLNTLESIIDLFLQHDCPCYPEFYQKINDVFDFEIASQLRGDISRICDAYKEVLDIIQGMKDFLNKRENFPRKELALDIIKSYGNTNRASFLFTLKDRGTLDKENIKKILFQVLK